MSQIISDVYYSSWFWPVVAIWIFIAIAWTTRWRLVLARMGKIIPKPVIFEQDPNPENLEEDPKVLYPRKLMESIAIGFRDGLRKPLTDLIANFWKFIERQIGYIFNKEHPFRILGYVLFLIAFGFFVLADAISVASTLQLIGILTPEDLVNLPKFLLDFNIAAFAGSLLALIMSFVIYLELQSESSELSNLSERSSREKRLYAGLALLTILLSILTLIAYALFKLSETGVIASSDFLQTFNWTALYAVVPINSAIVAALCFPEAMRGMVVVLLILELVLFALVYLANYLLTLIGVVLPFTMDMLYRLVFVVLDILLWFITTPIFVITWPVKKIIGMLRDDNAPPVIES